MKVEITKRQLEAIAEIMQNIDAIMGCSSEDSNFDNLMNKELKIINRFFIKNGYKPPTNT